MRMPESLSQQSIWLSAGLFVVVALASQVIQNQRQQQETEEEELDHDYALGHRYSMKRLTHDRRFSREDLSSMIVEQELKLRKREMSLETVCIKEWFDFVTLLNIKKKLTVG